MTGSLSACGVLGSLEEPKPALHMLLCTLELALYASLMIYEFGQRGWYYREILEHFSISLPHVPTFADRPGTHSTEN